MSTFTDKIVAGKATDKEIRTRIIVGAVHELTRLVNQKQLPAAKARSLESASLMIGTIARQWRKTRWSPVSAWIDARSEKERESLAQSIQRAFAASRKRTTAKAEKSA